MIRPGTLEDIDRVHDLMTLAYPGFVITLEGRRYALTRHYERPGTAYFAIEEGGLVAAWASTSPDTDTSAADVWWINVIVDGAARGRGLGQAVYERAVEHAVGNGALTLTTTANATDAAERFAAARGWEHTHTERMSAVDPRVVAPPEPDDGVEFLPFSAFEADPRPIYEIDMAVSVDVPSEFPFDNVTYDEWLARWWRHPDIDLEIGAAVLVDSQPVGISMLRVDRATGRAGNDITGTLREHRGRGLATALERETLRRCAQAGIERVLTGDDATNAPMLRINERLGYRPFAEHLTWVKRLA